MDFNEYEKGFEGDISWQEEYDMDLAHLITEARIHAGITQEELARRLDTKQPSVARAESGAVLSSHGFLKRVAEAVGTTLLAPRLGFMEHKEATTYRFFNITIGNGVSPTTFGFGNYLSRPINHTPLLKILSGGDESTSVKHSEAPFQINT